jgi:hypothetical protein
MLAHLLQIAIWVAAIACVTYAALAMRAAPKGICRSCGREVEDSPLSKTCQPCLDELNEL